MRYIFLSYSRQDSIFAEHLKLLLEQQNFRVEMDRYSIHTGQHWKRELCRLIDRCSVFMVVMSPRSYNSKWVKKEIQRAKHRGRRVFPILLEGSPAWPELANYQFELMTEGVNTKLDDRLIANLTHVLCRPHRTAEERLRDMNASISLLGHLFLVLGTLVLVIIGYLWMMSLTRYLRTDDLFPFFVTGMIIFSSGLMLTVIKRVVAR